MCREKRKRGGTACVGQPARHAICREESKVFPIKTTDGSSELNFFGVFKNVVYVNYVTFGRPK